jgi:glutathione S-transferase
VLTGHTLRWARNALGELGDERLEAYADRVLARPALARAVEREQGALRI